MGAAARSVAPTRADTNPRFDLGWALPVLNG